MTSNSGRNGKHHWSDSVSVYRQAVGTDGLGRVCSGEGSGVFFFWRLGVIAAAMAGWVTEAP